MEEQKLKVYGYRWVVLAVFSMINLVIQLNWIVFAPITTDCIRLYETTPFWIVTLSMSFMFVYLFVCVPASYMIDRFGIRVGVGIGALLTGIFGCLRAVYATDLTMVLITQFGLAVAQPFILNAMTRVAAEWFPINERATANGIPALFQFVGIIIAMALTKPIAESFLPEGAPLDLSAIQSTLTVYGVASVVAAVAFMLFARDKPPTPPSKEEFERISVFKGLGHIFKQRDAVLIIIMFFIGLGMFNAISTFIDLILGEKGLSGANDAGDVGAVMMVAGVIGASVLPPLSDKARKRKIFLIISLGGMIPGLIGLTFFTSYVPLMIASGFFGFFFMASYPIGFQYGAEVSSPAPESTTQGMIVLAGQVSGTIFITLMALFGNVSMEAMADATQASTSLALQPFMIGFIVLSLFNVVLCFMIKESEMIQSK